MAPPKPAKRPRLSAAHRKVLGGYSGAVHAYMRLGIAHFGHELLGLHSAADLLKQTQARREKAMDEHQKHGTLTKGLRRGNQDSAVSGLRQAVQAHASSIAIHAADEHAPITRKRGKKLGDAFGETVNLLLARRTPHRALTLALRDHFHGFQHELDLHTGLSKRMTAALNHPETRELIDRAFTHFYRQAHPEMSIERGDRAWEQRKRLMEALGESLHAHAIESGLVPLFPARNAQDAGHIFLERVHEGPFFEPDMDLSDRISLKPQGPKSPGPKREDEIIAREFRKRLLEAVKELYRA